MREWRLLAWGDYGCFTRPEMKVERVSYDVMTPSAARGIFDAILWKPAILWHVTKIEVLNPIRWVSARRNEIGVVAGVPDQARMNGAPGASLGVFADDSAVRQQRAGLFLRDVRYLIHGWFEFIPPERRKHPPASREGAIWADAAERDAHAGAAETEAKYAAMCERRARKGQCFHRPYLGCREFACAFRLVDDDERVTPAEKINPDADLGWMLYDMDFTDKDSPKPQFFRARLENGVLNTDRRTVEVRS